MNIKCIQMVDTLSLGIAVLAVIISIIAVILAFVIPGSQGPPGPSGSTGATGATGGSNFSGFQTVENGSNIEFIPGMFYNVSGATASTLLTPTNGIKPGDSITFSNNTVGVSSLINMSQSNGGYCQWGYNGPLENVQLVGVDSLIFIATGNSCSNGSGVEVYIPD